MDEIGSIVDRAIEIADEAELRAPHRKLTALKYLRQLAHELRDGAPDHPALKRLEKYLDDHDA